MQQLTVASRSAFGFRMLIAVRGSVLLLGLQAVVVCERASCRLLLWCDTAWLVCARRSLAMLWMGWLADGLAWPFQLCLAGQMRLSLP
jgi:hypothetical protein